MKEFWLIAGMALVTFLIRYPMLAFLNKLHLSPEQLAGLKFVPPAVLSALIASALFIDEEQLNLSWGNERLIAGIVASLVAYKSKNLFLTILVGMLVFFVFRV